MTVFGFGDMGQEGPRRFISKWLCGALGLSDVNKSLHQIIRKVHMVARYKNDNKVLTLGDAETNLME